MARAPLSIPVAGEATTVPALLDLLGDAKPGDILVTDYAMRGPDVRDCDGFAMLARLRRVHPGLRIIVLTDIANPSVLSTIIETGARGLVDKTSPKQELLNAIHKVAIGRLYFCRAMRMALDGLCERSAPPPRISPRETEVIRLFAEGLTVSGIAARLSRSVKTISRQKSDAMRKLGLSNNAQLYLYARESGLMPSGQTRIRDAV
ncbi:LuxR C-terminal-related transcriptional regulator [Luteimonas sp. WGS1318]|uniref:LuxR C-terminal-related transcriptional regulator n=1 Tax=Luteimonas sp. WGS1318 TaxID=3366815 RepID=UPI00372D58A1